MITSSSHKVVIVGFGITGAWLARKLEEARIDYVVISSDFDGGLLSQIKSDGFTFEIAGGHVYTANDYRVSGLMKKIDSRKLTRKAYYMHDGRFVGYPVQDHASEIGLNLNPREGYEPKYRYRNLEEYVRPIFGKDFTIGWFAPFNGRVWKTPIYQMDSDWVNGRVKVAKKTDPSWGSNAEFYYAPGSLIFDEIKKAIPDDKMRKDVVVFQDLRKKELTLLSGKTITYDYLVWTPSFKFLLPQLGISHTRFETTRLMNLCIGLTRKFDEMADFHWYYPSVKTSNFNRVNKLSNYHPSLAPDGKDSLMLEMTFRSLPPFGNDRRYSSTKFEQFSSWVRHGKIDKSFAVDCLKDCGISTVSEDDIQTSVVVETPGYPIPLMGIREDVAKVKRQLLEYDAIPAGRFGSHAYFNIDHCMEEAELVFNILLDKLTKVTVSDERIHDYLWSSFYYQVYRGGKIPQDYISERVSSLFD